MEGHQNNSFQPLAKLLYLIAAAISLFFITAAPVLVAILLFQLLLWQFSGLKWQIFGRSLKRLGLFFFFVLLSYSLLGTGEETEGGWLDAGWLQVSFPGISLAGIMCLRVLTLVLISLWVQNSSREGEFVASLKMMRIPHFLSIAIDVSLVLLSAEGKGKGGGGGSGKGKGQQQKGGKSKLTIIFKQLRQGDLGFLYELIEKALKRSEKHITSNYPDTSKQEARDIAVVAGMTVAMMGLKIIQLMPGLPIAPGHKNLLMIPMFLLAAHLTTNRFGGLWTGLTMGVVNFLFGFGKYGILEIIQFAIPGLLADLLLPLTRGAKSQWARVVVFAMVGAILGFGRFSANAAVLILAGTPLLAVIALLPMLFSQVFFGTLSGIVSSYLLGKDFKRRDHNGTGDGSRKRADKRHPDK